LKRIAAILSEEHPERNGLAASDDILSGQQDPQTKNG
jgi:hypothetical protein